MKKELMFLALATCAVGFNPCSNGMKKEPMKANYLFTPMICFNPCSNGMKKELTVKKLSTRHSRSFNPCSNGMKKELFIRRQKMLTLEVLILVLME